MPESTTSQSPQEVFDSSSEQWSQEIRHNNVPNDTNLVWNAVPSHNVVPLATNVAPGYIPHAVNNGMPVAYNPAPSYINLPNQQPYSRYNHIQHGYPIVSIPNTHNGPAVPVLARPPHRPQAPNPLATQQNIKLIQTAWNKTNGGVKKQKRIRTAFTSHQMVELEQEYSRTRYLDRTRRIELADILRLNERTIKIWFQNRRMKEKKDRAESLEEVDDVTTTQSPPDVSVPMFQEQYQANSEAFNRMGVFVEEYPVSSTSAPMTAEVQMPISYPGYSIAGEGPPAYDQVYIQAQHYSSSYGEVQEFSPDSAPQSQSSISVGTSANVPSDITNRNWDLSWVKSMKSAEE